MILFALFTGGVLMVAAAAATAQPTPSDHAQHQASGQHPVATDGQQCCCEEMMHKMMIEVMQKHQSVGTAQSKPNMDQRVPDEHQQNQ